MELDGYSRNLGLAFEYQGFQHYEPSFMYSPEEFAWQQQKDREKRVLCEIHKVILIEVPWMVRNLPEFVEDWTTTYEKARQESVLALP